MEGPLVCRQEALARDGMGLADPSPVYLRTTSARQC